MKVAIVGFGSTRDEAPWRDPAWQLWGLAWDPERLRFHRTFEMHDLSLVKDVEALKDCASLHMQEAYFPGAIRYPFEEVQKTTGAYWCSSTAYALALAIHEGADEIGIYGVTGQEQYSYQHPNLNYLIGLARGRGIVVRLPEACPLLKFVSDPDFDYDGRYGRLHGADH